MVLLRDTEISLRVLMVGLAVGFLGLGWNRAAAPPPPSKHIACQNGASEPISCPIRMMLLLRSVLLGQGDFYVPSKPMNVADLGRVLRSRERGTNSVALML